MPVMDGGGYYNDNSAQQQEAATAGIEMVRRAAEDVTLPTNGPAVIADLGSSEGRNSLAPLAAAVDALRARVAGRLPIVVVHTDLPDNDFSTLFEVVATDPDSYRRDGVFTYAAGRSFYDRLFPASTLTLGWSSTAVLWLSAPPCELPDHIFSFMASGPEHAAWTARASEDWATFLANRAHELTSGAQLVVTTLAAAPQYVPWMELVEAGVRDAVAAGALTSDEFDHMAIPTYLRDYDELIGPIDRTGSNLELIETTTITAADPAYDTYQTDGDADRYASAAVGAMRAWSEPSLTAAVGHRRDRERSGTMQQVYDHIETRLGASPTPCAWSITLLRVRRS